MKVGDIIQHLRDEKGFNQKELAEKVNLSQSVMNRIELGTRPVRDEELKKIAEVLGTTTDYLLGASDIRNPYSDTNIKLEEQYTFPDEFTNADEARAYVNKHQIFGSGGFDADRLDDDEILEFANALLEQMKMVSYKYKKWGLNGIWILGGIICLHINIGLSK